MVSTQFLVFSFFLMTLFFAFCVDPSLVTSGSWWFQNPCYKTLKVISCWELQNMTLSHSPVEFMKGFQNCHRNKQNKNITAPSLTMLMNTRFVITGSAICTFTIWLTQNIGLGFMFFHFNYLFNHASSTIQIVEDFLNASSYNCIWLMFYYKIFIKADDVWFLETAKRDRSFHGIHH